MTTFDVLIISVLLIDFAYCIHIWNGLTDIINLKTLRQTHFSKIKWKWSLRDANINSNRLHSIVIHQYNEFLWAKHWLNLDENLINRQDNFLPVISYFQPWIFHGNDGMKFTKNQKYKFYLKNHTDAIANPYESIAPKLFCIYFAEYLSFL